MIELAIKSDNAVRGSLFLNNAQLKGFTKLAPSVISITEHFQPERERVEAFIEAAFEKAYGARIGTHYPTLMSVRNEAGDILAAIGFRAAGRHELFLEQYLPASIDACLSDRFGKTVGRDAVVEIGSLASAGGGASIFLFIALVAYLKGQGFDYATVTATRTLRSAFRFLGLEAIDLGSASKDQLHGGADAWGTYYDTEPRVLAGALEATYAQLERYVPAHKNGDMRTLFARLHPGMGGAA